MENTTSTHSEGYHLSLTAKEFREAYSTRLYWWTWHVTQLIGGYLAPRFLRLGLHPNVVSLASALSGILTSVGVILLYGKSPILTALLAFVGWQLSFTLDYTDGQMARAGGLTSTHGAILDLLCDHLVQMATALAAVHVAVSNLSTPWAPTIAAVLVSAWLIPFVHGISFTAWRLKSPGSVTIQRSGIASFLRQGRDFGVQISVVAIAIAISSWAVLAVLAAVSVVNALLATYNIYSMSKTGDQA